MATIDMKATGANIRAYIKNNKMKIAEVQAVFGVGIGDIVVVSRSAA